MGIALNIVIIVALVLLNAFFVAAEFALVKIRETQLDTPVAKGHRRAKVARHIISHLNSFLSATQLGITMASLGLGWVGEPLFTQVLCHCWSGWVSNRKRCFIRFRLPWAFRR